MFTAIFRPEFCAYTRDGQYVSETFECQACQRKDAFAVRRGACNKPNEVNQVRFDGTYRPSITDDSDLLIRLEIDGKLKILNACNNPFGTYKAFDDGSISFS